MPLNIHVRSFATIAVALSLGACSVLRPTGGSAPARATDGGSSGAAPANASASASGAKLTDANIAAIVVAANNADIAYAEQALAKSRDAEIRQFANMTKKDHETVNDVAVKLVTRLKVTPVDNEISFDLRDDSEEKRGTLRDLEGFAFDSAYIANEVSYHKNILGAIDGALIPSAKNAELKALLVQVRPAVAAHLAHAESIAAKKSRRR